MDENKLFKKLGIIHAALQTLNENVQNTKIGITLYDKTKVLCFPTMYISSINGVTQ